MRDWKSYGRKLRVTAILTFVLFFIFGGAMLGWRLLDHDRPKGVTALAMTTRSRPIQGRLSGKIRHAPFTPFKLRPRLRGSITARPKQEEPESSERVRAMAEIFAADLEHPTPRTKAESGFRTILPQPNWRLPRKPATVNCYSPPLKPPVWRRRPAQMFPKLSLTMPSRLKPYICRTRPDAPGTPI